MNYPESVKILKMIKEAKKILLNCHRSPDADSIGSALAIYQVLKVLGKEVEIICPSGELYRNVSFLKNYKKIQKGTDFSNFDYSNYDVFITLDSSSWDMVSRSKTIPLPDIPIVVIDHHTTNTYYGKVNLVDKIATSVGEMIFRMFNDWEVAIDKDTSTCLMTAIVGDTGAFRYPNSTARTFDVAKHLMKLGADKDKIIFYIYRSEPYELVKFWGEVLLRMKLDKEYKFVWSAIPYEIFDKLGRPENARETAASFFTQNVEGTEFGFVALELKRKELSISFRSRTGFDTSKIAVELEGGGHIYASGGTVKGLSFDKAMEKVLKVVRKHAKKYQKESKKRNKK